MKHLSLLLLPVAALLPGCVQFESRPLDPAGAAERLESRSLADADLQAYLKEALGGVDNAGAARAWTLNELTAAGLYFHPSVDLAWKRAAVARAEVTGAAERPNPSLSVSPGYNSSSEGISPWIFGLGVAFPIETAGKRRYRTEEATLRAEAGRLRVAAEAWRVRQGVRAALDELAEARETAARAAQAAEAQEKVCALLERQRAAGEASRFDLAQALVEARKAALATREAEGRQGVALSKLAAAIGIPASALEGVRFDYGAVRSADGLADAAVRRAALTGRAELLAALKEYEASEAALRLAIAGQYPDLQIGPGYEFDQSENKWSLGASLTLPVFNRNGGAIKKALAQREEAAAAALAIQVQVLGEVDQALAAVKAVERRTDAARALLEASDRRREAAEAMRKAGEMTALDVLTAQADTARARLDEAVIVAEGRRALGQLEDALQRPCDLPEGFWANLPGGTCIKSGEAYK